MLVSTQGALKMQFMILVTRHPDKAETPAPADLREAEVEKIRGLYADGLVQQIWLRGDAGGACAIVEAASTDEVAEKLNALPLVRKEVGRVDVVFANAGLVTKAPLGSLTEEHVDNLLAVNVKGVIWTVQKALPLMGPGGSIILNASIVATKGWANWS